MKFKVEWAVEVEATSHEEAVEKARNLVKGHKIPVVVYSDHLDVITEHRPEIST